LCQKFPNIRHELQSKYLEIGDCVSVTTKAFTVLSLVTKEFAHEKPSEDNFRKSIVNLAKYINMYNVKKVSMPQIGSGRDKLNKDTVKLILLDQLKQCEVKVEMYVY